MRLFGEHFTMGVLRDPVSATVGAVGAGGNIISGFMGSKAAKKAAKLQAEAAAAAGKHVEDVTAGVNPAILKAAADAGAGVTDSAKLAAAGVTDASGKAAGEVKTAADLAAAGVTTAATDANKILDPYSAAGAAASGTLQEGLKTGGDFNKTFGPDDFKVDPSYEWRLKQGQAALDRSAAARGGVTSGGNIKAQTDYAQGAASQEYQNAFDRFQSSTAARYGRLKGVSDSGQVAGTAQGSNLLNAAVYGGNTGYNAATYGGNLGVNAATYGGNVGMDASKFAGSANIDATNLTSSNTIGAARTAGDYMTQGANAKAAGTVGSANAWGAGIGGAANAVTQAMTLKQLLANPATVSAGKYLPPGYGAIAYQP